MPSTLGNTWSLKKKITLFTLSVFIASMWSLGFVVIQLMRKEMSNVLGSQLHSIASMQAKDLNSDFLELIDGLEKSAVMVTADLIRKPESLQIFLESRGISLDRFNSGYFITDANGIVRASLPLSRGRVGRDFTSYDFVNNALKQNKTVIGNPQKGRILNAAIFGIATPIHDPKGQIIGVLAGVINLNEPSFMDHFTESTIGKSGGYWIIQPTTDLIVTATDKSRVMTLMSKEKIDPLIARFNAGYEGYGIHKNTLGEERLSASSNIPVVGWRYSASLPTSEALAPVAHMQQQMIIVTLMLMIAFGYMTWWVLRRQLNSLSIATEALTEMTKSGGSFKPLPIIQNDEVGKLINGFNSLLALVDTRTHELVFERQNLSNILEGTGAGTWVLNLKTGESSINERWAEMMGYTLAELNPFSFEQWSKMCHPSDLPMAQETLRRYLKGECNSFDVVTRMRHKNGNWIWVQSRAKITERGSDGRALLISGINLDISHEKAFEISLVEAKQKAELANIAKSQFLSNMSHEIRTPMNAILGLLQLLQSTELTHRQLDYIVKSESAAKSLLGLINDILDLSKMEAGKLELDPQPFLVSSMLRDLSVILSTGANNHQQEVLFDVCSDIPKVLIGDLMRIKQVLINLGGNAIKFTPQGTVVLQIRVVEHDEEKTTLRFAIIDNGIGISPEQQQRIFDNFAQAESSTTRRYGGSGLGLSICKKLVDLMGSDLKVESALGKGSTFYFTLTLPNAKQMDAKFVSHSAPAALTGPLQVLVVDDSPQSREIMAAMVLSMGWQSDVASSGAEAIAMVQARKRTGQTPYKIVLIDWLMPDMDGWQTLEKIQSLFTANERPLSIMVSAHDKDMLNQRTMYEHVQLDGYVIKPVTTSTLYDVLVEAESVRQCGLTAHEPVAMQLTLDGLHILLVEDNLINQQVAKELLQGQGARVDVADNGQLGVEAIANARPMFDVVLMDLQMPVMDGLMATRKIRHDLGLTDLPIIAITANAMSSDREECLAAGMNAHVGKPFDLVQLVALLQSVCKRPSSLPVPDMTVTLPQSTSIKEKLDPRFLDVDSAIKRLNGNAFLYGQILMSFVDQIHLIPDQLNGCLQQGDLVEAGQLMHTLKGLSATVGADYLAELAKTAEDSFKSVSPNSELDELVAKLRSSVMSTCETARKFSRDFSPSQTLSTVKMADSKATVFNMLNELHQLLNDANMQALDLYAQLRTQLNSQQDGAGASLEQAMATFDFAQAAIECENLIKNLN